MASQAGQIPGPLLSQQGALGVNGLNEALHILLNLRVKSSLSDSAFANTI